MSFPRNQLAARRSVVVSIALFAELAGCSGVPVIWNSYYDGSYVPAEWRGNDLPVTVRGSPFAVPQTEFAGAVIDAMQGATFGVPTRFIPATQGAAPAYRVVMIFNPQAGLGYGAVCARPEPPDAVFGEAGAAQVRLLATFCRGDRAMTSAEGRIPGDGGPTSAGFRRGIGEFAMQLFPPINPENRPGSEFTP
jgi:hypothetical protein